MTFLITLDSFMYRILWCFLLSSLISIKHVSAKEFFSSDFINKIEELLENKIYDLGIIKKGKYNLKGKPDKFTLGTGHVKFFYDKLLYLRNRYEKLYSECKNRGFNVTYYGDAWNDVPQELMGDYEPNDEDRFIIRERISERLGLKT